MATSSIFDRIVINHPNDIEMITKGLKEAEETRKEPDEDFYIEDDKETLKTLILNAVKKQN